MLYFCFCHCLLLNMSFSKIHWPYKRNILLTFLHSFTQISCAAAKIQGYPRLCKPSKEAASLGETTRSEFPWTALVCPPVQSRNAEIMEGGQASSVLLLRKCLERIHRRDITHISDVLLFVLIQGRMAHGKQLIFL